MYALLKSTSGNQGHHDKVHKLDDIRIHEPALTHSLRRNLLNRHKQNFNWQEGGPKSPIKYLDRDSVEYSLVQAAENNNTETRMAKMTLYRSLAMQDRVWGGIYQYATGNWHRPHYVMTMANQSGYLRIYALAYALWGNTLFRDTAILIRKYLARFLLSPVDAFYAGQNDQVVDCDIRYYYALNENQRMHFGIPEIDMRILSRENGWAIEALACCYEYCHDTESLTLAVNAAQWILDNRRIADGGFSHTERPSYHLGDTLAMGRAALQLYRVTGDQDWLNHAINAADFIALHFHNTGGGFVPRINTRTRLMSGPGIDENISLMRFANLLSFYSGLKRHRSMAKHSFRFLCLDEVATSREEETGILLADQEYNEQPIQIMIIGYRNDQDAIQLHRTAMNHYAWYKKLSWFEPGEAPLQCQELYYGKQPVAVVKHPYCKTTNVHNPLTLEDFLRNL